MAKHHELQARERLLGWINDTLTTKGWRAYNWTLRAGLSDTSLTRFLSRPDTAPLPSAATIVALAEAADSNPVLIEAKKIALGKNVPLLDSKLLILRSSCPIDYDPQTLREELSALTDRRVAIVGHTASDKAYAVEVETKSMNAAGLLPGDHLVVEPLDVCPPRLGDTVVILTPCGKISPMRYQTPWLSPVTTDPEIDCVAIEDTTIHGVVVQMCRPMRRWKPKPLEAANGKEGKDSA